MGRRVFRYGELPLVLLALVEERPSSGYDLMAELSRLLAPAYRASPGSVYPALRALEEERLVTAVDGAGAAVFTATDAGRRVLEERRQELASFELRTGRRVRARPELEAVLDGFAGAIMALAGRIDPARVRAELDEVVARLSADVADGEGASHG